MAPCEMLRTWLKHQIIRQRKDERCGSSSAGSCFLSGHCNLSRGRGVECIKMKVVEDTDVRRKEIHLT
jgi:hypothetical protein